MNYILVFFSNVESQHINTSLDISKRVSYNFCSSMNSALISFGMRMKYQISYITSILKISCMQELICCKFLLALSDPLEKCKYGICVACGRRSALSSIPWLPWIQSSLMYYCLPELNATRVIKITKRNKTLSPITVRRRVEIKFSVESAFLYLVFCNKLVHVCGLTALRHKTTAWTMKPAQHIVVSIFGKSSIHTSWYVCVKQTEKVLFFSLKNGEVRYSGFNNCS